MPLTFYCLKWYYDSQLDNSTSKFQPFLKWTRRGQLKWDIPMCNSVTNTRALLPNICIIFFNQTKYISGHIAWPFTILQNDNITISWYFSGWQHQQPCQDILMLSAWKKSHDIIILSFCNIVKGQATCVARWLLLLLLITS